LYLSRKIIKRETRYFIRESYPHFNESFAGSNPQILSQDKVDEHFINQICRLNTDRLFWAGMQPGDRLNEYLVRYVLNKFVRLTDAYHELLRTKN